MRGIERIRPLIIVVAVGVLSLHGLRAAVQAQYAEYVELFSPAAASREPAPLDILGAAMPGSVERIEIDLAALRSPAAESGRVQMTFGRGAVSLKVERDDTEWSDDRTLSWFGKIEDGGGSVLFSVHRDAVYGSIETGTGAYRIEPAKGSGYWLYQLDSSKEAQIDDGGARLRVPSGVHTADDSFRKKAAKTTLTVLVIYTKGFKKKYPGAALKAQVNLLIQWANLAYKNSKVPLKLEVVGRKKRNYPDGGTPEDTLEALSDITDAVGVFRKVPRWRDQFAADLVVLLRVKTEPGYCGIAWRMDELSVAFAKWAYSVTHVGILPTGIYCHDRTLVHEFGHNLGSNHNKGDDGLFKYSLGHRFGKFRTVMSYQSAKGEQAIQYFSNPDVDFQGKATGKRNLDNTKSFKKVLDTAAAWSDNL